jgi:competence protein ComFC
LISKIINHLFPSDCPVCGHPTDTLTTAPFCAGCWSGIEKYTGPSCKICATPFSSEYAEICSGCLKKPPLFSKAMSFGIYKGTLSEAINLFKFHGMKRLSKPLGKFLIDFNTNGIQAIVPVPLSIGALRDRGFNQSLLLAKTISDNKDIPLIMDGLFKKTETLPQIGLSAKDRIKNLKGTFIAARQFKGENVMLVDDVMTTGATANECSRQLIKAGASKVVVLTLARAAAL